MQNFSEHLYEEHLQTDASAGIINSWNPLESLEAFVAVK